MKRFLLGGLAAALSLGYLAWSERGEGSDDHGNYRWFRLVIGSHGIEIHIGEA